MIIEANPANINIENATYDAREQMIHLFSYTEGIIGITLYNETANVKSNICMVTFGSTNTGNDNNDDNNLGNNEDDNNNDNNNDGEDVSENINAMFIGTWYCSKGSLMAYLEFYSDGTGKAYMNDSNNYSSFRWSINNNILTFEGNVRNTTAFTITEDTLYLDSLCGLNNLTYTKQ